MNFHVYKKIELVGSSNTSIEDAISNAIAVASRSLDHIDWFEVVETRGEVKDGTITYYQVTVRVGFRLNNDAD
jgi:flavin-binding protein dodecin